MLAHTVDGDQLSCKGCGLLPLEWYGLGTARLWSSHLLPCMRRTAIGIVYFILKQQQRSPPDIPSATLTNCVLLTRTTLLQQEGDTATSTSTCIASNTTGDGNQRLEAVADTGRWLWARAGCTLAQTMWQGR